MKLRLYTLLASSLLSVVGAFACTEEWRVPNCYMFSIYNRNEQTSNTDLNVKFWKKYTGERFTEQQVLAQLNNAGSYVDADNLLLNALKAKGDQNGVDYLEKLRDMKKAALVNENSWNYPSKSDLAQSKSDWANIYNFAMNKLKGKRTQLNSRYVLMAMRGAFYSGKFDVVNEIWLKHAKEVHEKDINNQCQGYLAYNWIKSGWTEKARDFYIKSGALNDLRATFPQKIQVKDIKAVFDKYPESASLPYMIQDFLNSQFSNLHPTFAEKTTETDSLTRLELTRFCKLAVAASNSAIQSKSVWYSALGYSYYLLGDDNNALKAYSNVMKSKPKQRVAFNTRCLVMLCRTKNEAITPKTETGWLKELTWLRNTAAKEKPYYDYANYRFRNHYTDVMDHIVHDILIPRYIEANNPTTAAILANMANELNETQSTFNQRCTLIKRDSTQKGFNSDYSTDVFRMLDTMSTESAINYYNVMTNASGTELEQGLAQFCYNDNVYLSDIIATKLMREFKFKSALVYLKKVDDKFAANMNVTPYMAYSYSPAYWVNRNRQEADAKLKKKPYQNKIKFCKDMMKLEEAVAKAQQKKKLDAKYAANAYQLANGYLQASPVGACWALTNYSWSSYRDSASIADNAYIKRAQTLFRSAYSADMSEENMVNCLSGLFFISSNYSPSSDQEKLAKLLWRLKDTPSGSNYNIGRCDVLKNYIAGK